MSVEIARRVRVPVSDAVVRQVVMAAMRHGHAKGDVSVAFVGPARMRVLNRTYHEEDRVTDVLAFRVDESTNGRESTKALRAQTNPRMVANLRKPRNIRDIGVHSRIRAPFDLGELVICPAYIRQQAKRAGEPFRRELTRVLVHGTLHLLGHDHATPREAEKMFAMQDQLVSKLH